MLSKLILAAAHGAKCVRVRFVRREKAVRGIVDNSFWKRTVIENENQLRVSIEHVAKMYGTQEREAVEPAWYPEMRQEMTAETEHMRLKIEREIAEYLAAKYGYVRQPAELPAVSAAMTEQAA